MLQKKFRDLGEFVEGKEEMEIVINKTYRDENHAIMSICMPTTSKVDDDKSDEEIGGDTESGLQSLVYEDGFQHDIEELAIEEENKVKNEEDDDEDNYESQPLAKSEDVTSTSLKGTESKGKSTEVGSSQQHAICLSEDEDEDESHTDSVPLKDIVPRLLSQPCDKIMIPNITQLPNSKYYFIYYNKRPSYGVAIFSGRLVLMGKSGSVVEINTGDIVCLLNEKVLAPNMSNGLELMRNAFLHPPVRLLICRNKVFTNFFIKWLFKVRQAKARKQSEESSNTRAANVQHPSNDKQKGGDNNGTEDVIELD